jgi:hypothetical protein
MRLLQFLLPKFLPPRRHGSGLFVAILFALAGLSPATHASGQDFPYDKELRFDANPVRGSKRVPGLQISEKGAVEIDLWCVSGKAHAVIIERQITIVPISMQDNQCPADRLRMDEELLNKLTQVTAWRWEGQLLVLVGPQLLRFRPTSN